MVNCKYGCGQEGIYKSKSGEVRCCESPNSCPSIKKKTTEGLLKSYKEGKRLSGKDKYKTLSKESKDKMVWNKGDYSKVEFEYGGSGSHKSALIQERGHKCESCGLEEWLGKPITLELEHSDGDRKNNTRENLQLFCPNCHSQTPTWRGKNINSGKVKVSDNDLLEALNSSKNIRQALQKVGLTPKGGNYARCNKLLHNM